MDDHLRCVKWDGAEVGNSITVQRKIVPRLDLSPQIAVHNSSRYMCRSEQNQKCIGQTGAFGTAFIGCVGLDISVSVQTHLPAQGTKRVIKVWVGWTPWAVGWS